LENKLEQLIKNEASKSLGVKIQVVEKGTNTNSIHVTTQEGAKSIEVRTFSDVGGQTVEIPNVDPTINKATSVHEEDIIPKANRENTASTIREIYATKTLYLHSNHKSRFLNQLNY